MNAIGIIAEYNPFHLGHKHQLDILKKEYPDTPIIVAMSGSFVQRGEVAIFDKFKRASWAILNGADVVIELPSYYAVANAEHFASGGIKLFKALNISHCSFGAETNDIDLLTNSAKALLASKTNELLLENLASGMSYSTSLRQALAKYSSEYSDVIMSPNNLLGIEYIKASLVQNAGIKFIPIKRDFAHHDLSLDNKFASGSAIRSLIQSIDSSADKPTAIAKLQSVLAPNTFAEISEAILTGDYVDYNRLADAILLQGKMLNSSDLAKLQDFEEGLENLWVKAMSEISWTKALEKLKSKRYTFSRLGRMAAYTLLKRDKETYSKMQNAPIPYARILAFSNTGRNWLKNNNATIPLVNKWGAFYRKASGNAKIMADADILATNLQAFFLHNPELRQGDKDFLNSIFYHKN